MTKSYQLKVYLVDCKGYSHEDLEYLSYGELIDLADIKEFGEYCEIGGLKATKEYLAI